MRFLGAVSDDIFIAEDWGVCGVELFPEVDAIVGVEYFYLAVMTVDVDRDVYSRVIFLLQGLHFDEFIGLGGIGAERANYTAWEGDCPLPA